MGPEKLIKPKKQLKNEFLNMLERFKAANEESYKAEYNQSDFNFDKYLDYLDDACKGAGLPDWGVPFYTFWLVDDEEKEILGTGRLRYNLNGDWMIEGGHIGYDINPIHRKKGYGSLILKLLLVEAGKIGIGKVLITCDTDNIGSKKIIEKNGGVFDSEISSKYSPKNLYRYYIQINTERELE